MVAIRGFQGLRFNPAIAGPLDNVLTPPYDVIDTEMRNRLAEQSAYNMTHLMLPIPSKTENAYQHAARLLSEWQLNAALVQDDSPSIYLLRQHFQGPDSASFVRRGFFALLKLPEAGEKTILGHERTFDKPVEDRLALIRAVKADLEPVFVMYSDADLQIGRKLFSIMDTEPPLLAASTADGVLQELWRIACPDYLAQHLAPQTLYIADGHHRYKTACTYRDERRFTEANPNQPHGYDYLMAGFVAFEEPGLKIYAAHRIIPEPFDIDFQTLKTQLDVYFTSTPLPDQNTAAEALSASTAACALVMATRNHGKWLLELHEEKRSELVGDDRAKAWQDLDVAVLHNGLLRRLLKLDDKHELLYEKDTAAAENAVHEGNGALAFILRPTRPEQVRACAEAFEPMPQKSTYFFPKLPSGAVMYAFE